MTHGFPSIRSEAGPWNRARIENYLAIGAVGVLAGIAVAYGRMPLHLPGHKALLWIVPVLACRLVSKQSVAASVGASATVITALLLGGRLAGGMTAMPLVIIAGILLDLFAANVERNQIVGWRSLVILTLAGCAANLLCCLKRVFEPSGGILSLGTALDLIQVISFYALFGAAAGLIGGAIGLFIERRCGSTSHPGFSEKK